MMEKSKRMNDNTLKRKLLIIIALIIGTIFILSVVAYVFYLHERRQHLIRKRAAFDVAINNVASLGNIESIELVICGEKRLIKPYEYKNSVVWSDKISTPKRLLSPEGAPCPVEIFITKEGKTKRYSADQLFNCPDCSGLHYYEIIGDSAVYRYSP